MPTGVRPIRAVYLKEAHEEFRHALIVLGDSPILLAAALILLFLLLRDLAGEPPVP
jgi:hypothetical protein